ncbi:hypothetical protein ACO2Q3_10125 [Caulobacter sp. KR2-114]|uniref:hypothetical protein n=1 Tax=Caulobacter sp. KR2-114 TaxID=3400912 RepID=UPI003BFAD12C
MQFKTALNIVSAVAAFVAAALWLASALVRISPVTLAIIREDGTIQRPKHESDLRRQSALSAWAAIAAAVAAALQGWASISN